MTLLYKILGTIINVFAMLLAVSLVLSLPVLLSSPLMMLSGFMMMAIVLYSFFSARFHRKVLQQQQPVGKTLKDWIRVNGIVALIFSVIIIIDVVVLLKNPQLYVDAVKGLGVDIPVDKVQTFFYVMIVYALVLLTHVLWTFALMKKNKNYFQ
jgi:hypothetical protein